MVNWTSNIIMTVAGTGNLPLDGSTNGDGGDASLATFAKPDALALHGNNLFIADRECNHVRQLDLATMIITTRVGSPGCSGAAPKDPGGLALSRDGAILYVAETGAHRIWQHNLRTGASEVIIGNGIGESTGDDGPAKSAQVNRPAGLAVASNGEIYFSTHLGDHIRKFKPGGIVTRVANQYNIDGHSGDEPQPALNSRLNLLSGMCMAFSRDQKYLYVTDMGNRRLRRIYCPNNV